MVRKGKEKLFPNVPLTKYITPQQVRYLQGVMLGASITELNKACINNTPDIKKKLSNKGFLKLENEKGETGFPQFPIIMVLYSPFFQAEVIRGDLACIMLDYIFETRLRLPPIPSQKRLKVTKDLVGLINGSQPTLNYWKEIGVFDTKLTQTASNSLRLVKEEIDYLSIPEPAEPSKKRGRKPKSVETPSLDSDTQKLIDSLEA